MQNFDHNIGFWEKLQFFRRKLSKIAENCDHNIDPRRICEKIAKNVAQTIFCQKQYVIYVCIPGGEN
jgi:hypothetical protein